jgi:hypothetical protein
MKALILFTAFLIPRLVYALPDAPKPNHRIFYFTTTLLATSSSADFLTTRQLLDRGGHENNSLLGSHPSNGRITAFAASYFAAQSTAFYFTERSPRRIIRWMGRAYMGLAIFEHARLAACNSKVEVHSSVAHNCRSFMPF